MSRSNLKRIGGLITILALVGVSLLTTVTSASAASTAAQAVDLNGSWTDGFAARPIIFEINGTIGIDMSYANRPAAHGFVKDATISVTFPDDANSPYIGYLQGADVINWSNGSSVERHLF